MNIDVAIKDVSGSTPDPVRSFRNLQRLSDIAPEFLEDSLRQIGTIARLFAYSQFLADFCIKNPDILREELHRIDNPVQRDEIVNITKDMSKQETMRLLRNLKKRYILRITLRDITGITDINESMSDLSILADSLIELTLNFAKNLIREKFGDIKSDFSIISLGKLGANELNYSSDVDILSVYGLEDELSSGTLAPSLVRINRISAHEYFCKLTELLTSLLSLQTEDGLVYRVDLRLRPNGQKGDISMSLNSYLSYYESFGKTWERMALIRSRHVAGDIELGRNFLRAIEPFIWKRSIDYSDIEEIKALKRKIDNISDVNDIKRGYGGIREIEFFVQTFQLLYGGERRNLRTGRFLTAVTELKKEGFITDDDLNALSENYTFLRRLEHILQMRDDRQTHSLPVNTDELEIISKKMNFSNQREFVSELKLRRLKVRDMYNSLFGGTEVQQEINVLFDEELTDDAIMDYLSFKGFEDVNTSFKNFKSLSEQMSYGKTISERSLLRKTIPVFFEMLFKSENKDRALTALATFVEKIGYHESYIDLLSKRLDTIEVLVNTFSSSRYLTRSLLSLENLEGLFEYPDIRMDYKSVKERLITMLRSAFDPMNAIRESKLIEELKTGLLFIKKFIDTESLQNNLTVLADTILRAILEYMRATEDFAVIGFGGFGSRELTFGSDLDLIFVSENEMAAKKAEDIIKFISGYTEKGIAYKIDMGLRPDGSRGILVKDINGYREYYKKHAHPWEIQALIKARPVAGDNNLMRAFYKLKKEIVIERGGDITGSDVINMRRRIVNEFSRKTEGYDIKHGYGGIEEIGFLVQFLQLKYAAKYPNLIVHNTSVAIKRLSRSGIISLADSAFLLNTLKFLRTLETLIRLNDEDTLREDTDTCRIIVKFMGFESKDELFKEVNGFRDKIINMAAECYSAY